MRWRNGWRGLTTAALLIAAADITSPPVSAAATRAVPPVGTDTQYIVQFRSDAALNAAVGTLEQRGQPANDRLDTIDALTIDASNPELGRLVQSPQVVAVEPDRAYTIDANPPWGIDRIDQRSLPLSNTYAHGTSGSGVTAYIVDTGLLMTHQEFTGRIPRSWHLPALPDAVDCNGHGTHVAGTIGGTNFGVAPQVSIVPVRVFDCTGSALTSDIITALQWVVSDHVAGVPAVLNMSLGGPASTLLDNAVSAVIADGVPVVVAAGNSGADACGVSPARVPDAITVGATNILDQRAVSVTPPVWSSNFGTCLDLFAPGDTIQSAYYTSNTATASMSGTSMASPHVAGAVALYLEARPTAAPADVASAILSAATTGLPTGRLTGDPAKLLYVGPVSLTASRSGTGTGTVTSDVGGINCGATCVVSRTQGTSITLTATATPNAATFVGWSGGGCTGTGTCTIVMNGNTAVDAIFSATEITVTKAGTGSGTVTSDVGGINCGGTCTAPLANGTSVTLAASAAPGSAFMGWTGSGCSGTGTCTVTIAGSTAVTATFALAPRLLTVAVSGAGTVTSDVGGISCGSTCNATVTHGTTVTLTAEAGAGSQFVGWTGGGCGTAAVCAVAVTSDLSVTATFQSVFQPFSEPVRLFDTRPGNVGVLESSSDETARFAPGEVRRYVPGPSVGAPSDAVLAVNVVAVNPGGNGYLQLFPCASTASSPPAASFLNYTAGVTVANNGTVALDASGGVCVLSSQSANVIVDTTGYLPAGSFVALPEPVRLIDSRGGQLGALEQPGGSVGTDIGFAVAANTPWRFTVTGANGIPSSVAALALNIAAVGPAGGGFMTVYPCASTSTTPPSSSTINYRPGGAIANGTVVATSGDGGICVLSSQTTNVIIDTTGYFPVSRFTPLDTPVRLLDSRPGQTGTLEQPGGYLGSDLGFQLAANTPWRLVVTGANGIPASVRGLALNLVAVGPTGGGFITVYPCTSESSPVPASSTINYRAGISIANGAIVSPSADGAICVLSSQTTNVIIDTTGYFPA